MNRLSSPRTLLGTLAGCALASCFVSQPEVDIVEQLPPQPTSACERASLPSEDDRPEDRSNGEELPAILLAWSTVRFDASQGFDLDGKCTESPTCSDVRETSCRSRSDDVRDDDQCRDNGFARLIQAIDQPDNPPFATGWNRELLGCALWRGTTSILVRISGYSGTSRDARVRVDYYPSDGADHPPSFECVPGMEWLDQPRWPANARWRVDRARLAEDAASDGLPDSRLADADAYVKDGMLYAAWPDAATLRFSGPSGMSLRVHGGRLRARLRDDGGTWSMREGMLAGRIGAEDVLAGVRESALCSGDARYAAVEAFVRDRVDLRLDGDDAPDRDCDALSLAIGFEAEAATAGDPTDTPAPAECVSHHRCGDGVVSGDERCDTALREGPGACPAVCEPLDSCTPREVRGSDCGAHCAMLPSPRAGAADGCCPSGASLSQDPDCAALCGNGKLDGSERCDTAIAVGEDNACPTDCPSIDACRPASLVGERCERQCLEMPITMPGARDGCCPDGSDANNDADCKARCGNEVLEAGELCDPPSSCTECPARDCFTLRTAGSAATCNLRCEYQPITSCTAGDRCCPSTCEASNDNDCSASCGNRVIDSGELCEAGTMTPCPSSCDDGTACTEDLSSGGAVNCNRRCLHLPIIDARHGDGCCPMGATANSDDDCVARCGNRVVEAAEDCDDGNAEAGDGCAGCKTESQETTCRMTLGKNDACTACTCLRCAGQVLACHANEDTNEARLCRAVVECAEENECGNPDCLCGTASLTSCLLGMANGPCLNEMQDAAKTTQFIEISNRSTDLNYPLGRSNGLAVCVGANCSAECGSE